MQVPILVVLFLGLFFPSIYCSVGWCADANFPRVEIEYKIELSSAMKTALEKHEPDFEIWGAQDFVPEIRQWYTYQCFKPWRSFLAYQTPSIIIGDLNDDKAPDVVLLGNDKICPVIIVLLSKNKEYEVIRLTDFPLYSNEEKEELEVLLEYVPPQKIQTVYENNRLLDLKNDAFSVVAFEKCSSLYYYSNGKFVQYGLTD